jgi:short subunit dehydrogenase-like uncharacterized protein
VPRIVLFGATGYTGRLTAEALVRRGQRPVLAGRSQDRLEDLAGELGGLDVAVADVARPETVRALVERGDVLVATVGPFKRWGGAAAEAAVRTGAHYLDSTGEPPFIREVFERHGPAAARAGCGMLTSFGYDWVPGNLAGALALREAGEEAVRVDVGYFFTGEEAGAASGGTRASLIGAIAEPSFAFRDGRIVTERAASRMRHFDVDGKRRAAVLAGASENFALPRVAPQLREVNTYLGWFGPMSRPMQAVSLASSGLFKVPGAKAAVESLSNRLIKGSTGGPDADSRANSGSHIVGAAYDAAGGLLAETHVVGVNGYEFTAEILAWGAERAAAGGLRGTGALGPVDGFGLDELQSGCAEAGLTADLARPVAA